MTRSTVLNMAVKIVTITIYIYSTTKVPVIHMGWGGEYGRHCPISEVNIMMYL